jgi:hypothetical protein
VRRANAEALTIVRALLERGMLAEYLIENGGFEPWHDQQPDAVISRVKSELQRGDRDVIEFAIWFDRPS